MAKVIRRAALVVEDDHDMAELLTELLQMEGYEVVTETDGQSGFRRATTTYFDLLVVDIELPGWNGIDMLNSLAIVGTGTRVLVVTGSPASAAQDRLSNPQVSGVLQKPFDVEEFRRIARG